MDKSLKEIIKEVGKEYEMEDDIINEIIKKLQKEFYVKLKHMKNLSIETWKGLGLPINLYYVLNELYQSALAEQQPANQPNPQPQITQSPVQTYQEQVPNPQYQQKIQKNQNEIPNQLRPQIQYQQNKNSNQNNNILNNFINNKNRPNNNTTNNNINANDSLQNIVHNNLSILFTEIDNLDISRKVFKQIYTIISNIAHNPNDEKFRRFNIKKFTSTYKYKSIYTLFSSLGFKNVDEYMYLINLFVIIKSLKHHLIHIKVQ